MHNICKVGVQTPATTKKKLKLKFYNNNYTHYATLK